MHSMTRALTLCAAGAATQASLASFVYGDGVFAPGTYALTEQHTGAITSYAGTQQLSGGNPAEWRRIDHVSFSNIILTYHMRNGATYDPSLNGAIASVNFSMDVMGILNHAGIGIGLSPALLQNGNYYFSNSFVTNPNVNWVTGTLGSLTATDFRTLASAAAHPDFSPTGGPIQIGFVARNDNGGFTTSRACGIDNWITTINPVPEPATGVLLVLATGLVAARRLR